MARIALYQDPQQLRSGDRTLQPAQFRVADSGLAQGLGKLADVSISMATNLMQKKQNLDEADTLIKLDRYIHEDALARQKWFQENAGDDAIEKDGVNRWEMRAREDMDKLYNEWNQIPMSRELRLRVNERINNYADKAISGAWSSSLQQKGQNFSSMLTSLRNQAQQTGDFSMYDSALETAASKGIYSPEQVTAFKMDRDSLKTNVQLQQLNLETKDLIDTAPVLGDGNYEVAKQKWMQASKDGIVQPAEAKFQINQIEYKAKLGQKMKDLDLLIEMQPDKVIEAANVPMGTSASLGQIRAKYGAEIQDPAISQQLFELTEAEVGGQGREAQIAFMETIVNRAAVTGKSIKQIMDEADSSGRHYYEPYNSGAIGAARASLSSNPSKRLVYSDIALQVLAGSNLTKGATDNASADVAASVKQGGYDALTDSIVEVGGETFYAKRGRTRLTAKEGEQPPVANGIDLSWATPQIRDAAVFNAQQRIATVGAQQYSRLRDVIDTSIFKPDFDFAEELKKPEYRILTADPVMTDAIKAYHANKQNQANMNDDGNYEKLYAAINLYDPTTDKTGLKAAQLGATISSNFSGSREQLLKEHLNNIRDNAETRRTSSITSEALKQLTLITWKDQALGEYKKPKTVEATATKEVRAAFGIDYLWPDLKGKVEIPAIKTVKTEAVDPTTGAIIKTQEQVKIMEEDAEMRAVVAEKQAAIRQQLEDEIRQKIPVQGLGVIDTRDKAVKRMYQIARDYQIPIKESAAPMPAAPAATGALPALSPQDRIKRALQTVDEIKKRQQSTGQ